MFNALRRLLGGRQKASKAVALQPWADAHGYAFMHARRGAGGVVQGRQGTQEWRLEWGAPQRDYIQGMELRWIAELDLPKDLMVLVLDVALMERMERAVYERFVDDVQTRIDTETPTEMRWLVMHPRLGAADLGRLRERFGSACSHKPWTCDWLHSPLGDALQALAAACSPSQPLVMTIQRGRLVLRTEMAEPDEAGLDLWHQVFAHAVREARRLAPTLAVPHEGAPLSDKAALSEGDSAGPLTSVPPDIAAR
jgi:hypothetical protein